MKEDFETAYDFLKANIHGESLDDHNVNIKVVNPAMLRKVRELTSHSPVGIISGILDRPVGSGLVVLGETSLMGEVVRLNSLVDKLQLASDAGAKQVLLPTENKNNLQKAPNELLDELELLFYLDPINAASKAMNIK